MSLNNRGNGRRWVTLAICGLVVALAVVLSACGSSDDSTSSSSSGSSSNASEDFSKYAKAGGVAGAKEYLEKVQDEGQIDFQSFIPSEPSAAAADKTVAVILNGSAAEGAVRASEGMEAAGKALGWDVEVTDGQLDPNVQSQAINSAVTSQVDGIVLDSIAPVTVGGAVQDALTAEIPIVTTFDPGSPEEVSGVFADASNGTIDGGLALGAWIAADSNGKGRVVNVPDTSLPLTQQRADGVEAGLKKFCPECEILATQQNDIAAMATKLPSQTSADISRFGTKDLYMVAPFDAAASFMIQGAKDSKAPYFPILSMDGNSEALEAIANKEYLAATWAAAAEWMGWASLDQLNRAFNEEEPAGDKGNAVVPSLLVDKTNLPKQGGNWEPSFDYQSAYEKLWEIG
jgi:ribose transport system substrate-binding protein